LILIKPVLPDRQTLLHGGPSTISSLLRVKKGRRERERRQKSGPDDDLGDQVAVVGAES
jgi:hypothetical protein